MTKNNDETRKKLRRLHRLLDALCGVYSRVGSRLKRDRSYVSRVARGERRSDEVESALISEFDKITQQAIE